MSENTATIPTAGVPPPTQEQLDNRARPLSFGVVAFPGFEPLDIFGPLEVLYGISRAYKYPMTLSIIAAETGGISSAIPGFEHKYDGMIGPQVVATHTFDTAPKIDILLVPGGLGIFYILNETKDNSIEQFIQEKFPEMRYLLSVCTGSAMLAASGVLDGKRATSNKAAWDMVVSHGRNVEWVPNARWTEDGKIWTSSGVAAGIDMAYAFFKMFYGANEVNKVMNGIEYAPHIDPHWDPFAVVWKVPGANTCRSLQDCVEPVPTND